MKLKIKVEIVYPDHPPDANRPYATRHIDDVYEQETEIEVKDVAPRLENVIKAFNNFT